MSTIRADVHIILYIDININIYKQANTIIVWPPILRFPASLRCSSSLLACEVVRRGGGGEKGYEEAI